MKVEKKKAEEARQKIAQAGLLDTSFLPKREGKFVYFAVKGKPDGMVAVEAELKRKEKPAGPIKKELEGKLSEEEAKKIVGSFDIVGDIAVVTIHAGLEKKESLVAEAIMKNHRNVKVVAKKIGGTYGEYRIRPVKVIAGENRTHTICRESGCEFELDINKAYFSPRLGTERGRIASLVKPHENVLVPFAGVGPFAIRIGKAVPTANVVGIELNMSAVEYFGKNIERNKCTNVSALAGDVSEILPNEFLGWADRIAAPLPKGADKFLKILIPCLKRGGILHYYSFGNMPNPYSEAERQVKKAAKECGREAEVLFKRIVRPFSKETRQIVIDAKIN